MATDDLLKPEHLSDEWDRFLAGLESEIPTSENSLLATVDLIHEIDASVQPDPVFLARLKTDLLGADANARSEFGKNAQPTFGQDNDGSPPARGRFPTGVTTWAAALIAACLVAVVILTLHVYQNDSNSTRDAIQAPDDSFGLAGSSPAGCDVTPRSLASLAVLAPIATPASAVSPTSTPHSVVTWPVGSPVSDSASMGISITLNEYTLCGVTGEPAQILALVTDDFIARALSDSGLSIDEYLAEIAREQAGVAAKPAHILDSGVLVDGRVRASVRFNDETGPTGYQVFFVESNDRWLIDYIQATDGGSQVDLLAPLTSGD